MTAAPVSYRAADGVAWITLERPAVLNALNTPLAAALADHAERAAADPSIRAVVLGGAGRAFCSGMDRSAMADRAIGDLLFAHITTIAHKLKTADDWRNDEAMAGGDAFFEEGIHWLHLAGSLGPRITTAHGYRPVPSKEGPDTRVKSMMVAFEYDTGAVGSLYYSREVPSLLYGLRLSKLFGRKGVISFESNGTIMVVRGGGIPRLVFPGFRDIRGYKAMYRDFHRAITTGVAPEMSLERAMEDQRLMDQIYTSLAPAGSMAVAR